MQHNLHTKSNVTHMFFFKDKELSMFSLESLYGGQFILSNQLINQIIIDFGYNVCCHWLKERAL